MADLEGARTIPFLLVPPFDQHAPQQRPGLSSNTPPIPRRNMAKGGYARLIKAVGYVTKPPPTGANKEARRVTLCRWLARGLVPHKGLVAFKHYPNKSWGPILGLKPTQREVGDVDVPRVAALERLVNRAKITTDMRLQLQIMCLETKIYQRAGLAFENTATMKFKDHIRKNHYKEWATFTRGRASTSDELASSWAQYDEAPHMAFVVPELSTSKADNILAEEGRHYPQLLREWWNEGYVSAQIIDSRGTRTYCPFWQLSRQLGDQECHEFLHDVQAWALQAERLKMDLAIRVSKSWVQDLESRISELCRLLKLARMPEGERRRRKAKFFGNVTPPKPVPKKRMAQR